MPENATRTKLNAGGRDDLQGLILDSFEEALGAADHEVAFRLLKSLERHLLKPEISRERRTEVVNILVDAHRRLLEHHTAFGPMPTQAAPAMDYPATRH